MRRLWPLALAAFVLSSLLIWLFGDSGVLALGRLEAHRGRLAANVASLESLNRSLQAELASLRTDAGRIEALARDLGLYRPDDRVLRIAGAASPVEPSAVGSLLRLREPRRQRGPWLKAGGVAAVMLPAGLAAFLRGLHRRRRHGPRRR